MKARANVCTGCLPSDIYRIALDMSNFLYTSLYFFYSINTLLTFIILPHRIPCISSKYLVFRNFFSSIIPGVHSFTKQQHPILTNVIYDPFTHAHIQSSVLNLFFTCVCVFSLKQNASDVPAFASTFRFNYVTQHEKSFIRHIKQGFVEN